MISNLILSIGTAVMLSAPDMTDFRTGMVKTREATVRAFAQYCLSFRSIKPNQAVYLSDNVNGKPFAQSLQLLTDLIASTNESVMALGGESMTKEEFNKILQQEGLVVGIQE